MKSGRREFLMATIGAVAAGLSHRLVAEDIDRIAACADAASATGSDCEDTTIGRVAGELRLGSPDRPAWSAPVIGLDSLNAKIHYWGDPDPGQPILGGRPPFTAPNGVRDDYDILDWPGKAHWDPVRGDWWFSGGPTGNQDSASPTIVRYRPATDRFAHWQGIASRQRGLWPPSGHAHSFDAADLDVQGRRIWRHLTPHASEPFRFKLGWFDIDTHESGRVDGDGYQNNDYPTIAFMPANRLLHVIRPQPGTAGNIRRFDVDGLRWQKPLQGPAGQAGPSCHHQGAIYFTTSQGHFARVLPDGRVELCRPTPVDMGRPVSGDARYAILCPLGEYLYAFCGNGDIWRYEPGADAWGDGPYHRIPDSLTDGASGAHRRHYLSKSCVGPVTSEGVALFCTAQRVVADGVEPARAMLWKP